MLTFPMKSTLIGLTFLVATAQQGHAQIAYDSPRGRVEILGLRRWTLQMLRDSVEARRPGTKLYEAACMQLLREELGFPDASVNELTIGSSVGAPTRTYLVIKLIEPADKRRVQWLRNPLDTFKVLHPQYASVILPITDKTGTLSTGQFIMPLQLYGGRESASGPLASAPANVRSDVDRVWQFLDAHRSADDWRDALKTLRTDGAYPNRMMAVAVLSNFSDRDSTWWALADALRDPQEVVRLAAEVVLSGFSPRYVPWSATTESLRALVGGTNVMASERVFTMLSQTKVDPKLARVLLRGNGVWILSHFAAENPNARSAARAALVQLHGGRDLGPARTEWARWIAGL